MGEGRGESCKNGIQVSSLYYTDDIVQAWQLVAGARYTKSIASLELRHKDHNNVAYSLHNNTIDFTQ